MKLYYNLTIAILFTGLFYSCKHKTDDNRKTISLNGEWQFTITSTEYSLPSEYKGNCPVPGLGDMADFKIDSFGFQYSKKRNLWYKKPFTINNLPDEKVFLILNKVKFGHTVFVNGQKVGESDYCFTPSKYDITPFLKSSEEANELVVRVGAFTDNLDSSAIYGADFEKIRYLSGIYDDVELIITGNEHIDNIQIAPDIENSKIKLAVYMKNDKANSLHYNIKDKTNGKTVASGNLTNITWENNKTVFDIELPHFESWSPENPQLYNCNISSANDNFASTFGMRSFGFNVETGRAELNGETYFMRGTNICIFRFFEDPDRADLPWDTVWVRKLHRKFKSMGWNSIRYCIGFPPRFWYDIANEEGLLIQDEYPIWTGPSWNGNKSFLKHYPNVTPASLAGEFKAWMSAHWNHPCVVIWDAQNESVTTTTGEAIKLVRHLDLSDRPWENGWAAPDRATDPIEAHPYRFTKYLKNEAPKNPLKELISSPQIPDNSANKWTPPKDGGIYPNPIIINEYAWIWLNRNGTPTRLTDLVYERCFPDDTTSEQRLETYGKHLGILTEYWRAHRNSAGVLHFCGLGYSRSEEPRGQTSDHFIDIRNLTFDPDFVKYVKPAFNPVGVFLDWFEDEVMADQANLVNAIIINDLNRKIEAGMQLSWDSDSLQMAVSDEIILLPFEKKDLQLSIVSPKKLGEYNLVLSIKYDGKTIRSTRETLVKNKN
jgi:beta-galactosidase/beta-glucuronidase